MTNIEIETGIIIDKVDELLDGLNRINSAINIQGNKIILDLEYCRVDKSRKK